MEALGNPVIVGDDVHDRVAIAVLAEPDVDRRFDRSTKRCVINGSVKAADDAALDESLQPRSSRIRTQADRSTQLDIA